MNWFNWSKQQLTFQDDISSPVSFSFPSTPCIGSPYDSPTHSARSSISIPNEENEIQSHINEDYIKEENTMIINYPYIGQLDHTSEEYLFIPFVYCILEMRFPSHYNIHKK